MDTSTELLNYADAARALGISESSLRQLVNRGRLHPVKFPGTRRKFLRRDELAQYRAVRPVRTGPRAVPRPTMDEFKALLQSDVPVRLPDPAQQQALQALRDVVLAATRSWTEIAIASKRLAAASLEAADARRQAAEADERAMRENTRLLAASAETIREVLMEALHLYLPMLEQGYLLPLDTPEHSDMPDDEASDRTASSTDTPPGATPPPQPPHWQVTRALADKLLPPEADATR